MKVNEKDKECLRDILKHTDINNVEYIKIHHYETHSCILVSGDRMSIYDVNAKYFNNFETDKEYKIEELEI